MADHESGEVEEEDENVYELMIELRRSEPDHRDAVQKKTFTKWVNNHLQKVNVRILDLYEELRDGNNLLLLLELLCKTNLPRERGQLRFHRLQNVQTALEFLQSQQVKLVNIRSEDIVDGNPKLTLGLIWTIILHYQISEVEVVGKQEQMTAKEALLLWAQKVTQGYPSVEVGNFTSSWKDGLAFNAIIHRYRPDLVDFSKLNKATPDQNLEYSFHVAEKELGVPRLLDVEDLVHTDHPDEKSVMTYVSSLYEIFPKEPTVQEALHDNEKLFKFEEYCNLAKVLVVEINRVIQRLEKQRFPKTVQGIKELIVDYNRYRISEFPDMEASRHSLKMVFRELQALYGPMATWLEFPYECSPRELEVSWTRLVETQDNYNKSLRIELTRLEQMYHVAEKIQKEATLVDASLDDIEERIKSEEEVGDTIDNETRRKHFYQIEKSLVMFESSIKHMISGVDILIAGRYSRADELRIKIQSIERRWSEMKDRLETRSTKVLTYQTFSTSDGKKMKLELPVEKSVVCTEETTPSSDYPDEEGVKTRRKVITITKRTYRSSGGTPTETRTTVARIMSAEGLDDDSSDSGISPQGRTRVKMKFGTEEGTGNKSEWLDAMLAWIRETKDAIDNEDFGLDLPSAQKYQQNHHVQHDAVLAFQDELDKIKKLEAEDRSLHEKIIEIHEEYAALVKSSVDRINHLKSLVAFMSEATKELIWMNQREEPEVSRDWSCTDLDIEDLQAHGENLDFDIREREPHYNMLLAKGDNLIQTGHPAPGPIEAYLNAMRSQWWWLNQLIIAFQQHVRNAEMYQQYFQDAHTTEQKMIQLVERLNTEYDVQNICTRDAAEQALNSVTFLYLMEPFLVRLGGVSGEFVQAMVRVLVRRGRPKLPLVDPVDPRTRLFSKLGSERKRIVRGLTQLSTKSWQMLNNQRFE